MLYWRVMCQQFERSFVLSLMETSSIVSCLLWNYFSILRICSSKTTFWWLFRGNYSRDVFTRKHLCCTLFALYLVLTPSSYLVPTPLVMTGNMLWLAVPLLGKNKLVRKGIVKFNLILINSTTLDFLLKGSWLKLA